MRHNPLHRVMLKHISSVLLNKSVQFSSNVHPSTGPLAYELTYPLSAVESACMCFESCPGNNYI